MDSPKSICVGNQQQQQAPEDTTQAVAEAPAVPPVSKNPLLVAEIANHVLDYLGADDLEACFDVCQLWRGLVPSHNIRARSTWAPVVISGDMSDPAAKAYLCSIRKDPSFMVTRFAFRDAANSPAVNELLKWNGVEMEELELFYSRRECDVQRKSGKAQAHKTIKPLTPMAIALADLLRNRAPNLKTLIVKDLPNEILEANLFPDDTVANQNQREGNESSSSTPATATALALKRIEITTDCELPQSSLFLDGLFAVCPQLEEFELVGWNREFRSNFCANKIIDSLHCSNRLGQIKRLKFCRASPRCLQVLRERLGTDQLLSFAILQRANSENHVCCHGHYLPQYPNVIHRFLATQSGSLEYLKLPLDHLEPRHLTIPPMPNLVDLRLSNRQIFPPQPVTFQGPLNYAVRFPKLRVLGLSGWLENYVEDEIYPQFGPPCYSVQVLQEMPISVDQAIMARIGNLFPNLSIIRAVIPYKHESLLTSIWEFCPNITELFLTLGTDYKEQLPGKESLDSLFSGIPEAECRRLRDLPADDQERELTTTTLDFGLLRSESSILDLKKLKRVCIDGPGDTLADFRKIYGERVDKVSDVFGYSTLAPLARSKEFLFFQVRNGLEELTPAFIAHVCSQCQAGARLEHVTNETMRKNGPWPGREGQSDVVRLIKPGFKFEALGTVLPMEWYGLQSHHDLDPYF